MAEDIFDENNPDNFLEPLELTHDVLRSILNEECSLDEVMSVVRVTSENLGLIIAKIHELIIEAEEEFNEDILGDIETITIH